MVERKRLMAYHWGMYHPVVKDGRLVAMEPFSGDPDPSSIGASLPQTLDAPARIRRPAVRRSYLASPGTSDRSLRAAEPFVEIDWPEAISLVARELQRVREEYGNTAIFGGSYGWASAGRFHHAQSQVHRFLNLFGGYVSSRNSYSLSSAEVVTPHVVGEIHWVFREQNSFADVAAHTQLLISFGGLPMKNTQVNPGGVSRHRAREMLRDCAAAGVSFVIISPLRDDCPPELRAEWLAPRPNTDVAIMLALAHTLVHEGLHDEAFLREHCVGFPIFRSYLLGESDGQPKDAAWAARIAAIDAECIGRLARRMARSRTLINTSWSVQRADHGEQSYWMTVSLAAILGQIGLPGGGFGFGYGAVGGLGVPGVAFPGPTFPQGRNPVKEYIPVARIADMLLHPGKVIDYNGETLRFPDIRLIYWAGGNPFHHHQDLNRLVLAWRKPETIIVHEQFWNSSARHADIVLPVTTALERNDICTAMFDNVVVPMHQAVAPVGEARNDFDIFAAIAQRLGFADSFLEGRGEMQWLRHIYEESRKTCAAMHIDLPPFDRMCAEGLVELPIQSDRPPFLSDFRRDPARHPVATPSGLIEIFSERIAKFGYEDCPGHPVWLEPFEWLGSPLTARFPLHLISNQPRNKLHSQYDHGRNSTKDKINGREPLWINPADAAARNISHGDVIRVFNERGACLAGAFVTDSIRAGVVQLATGAWYDPLVPGQVGSLDRHGNPNMLTRDKGSSKLAQGSCAQTALVEIELYLEPVPPITVYDPPPFADRDR